MVYRGKPSAACEPCRRKRRKCDLNRAGCSQCARARIACPGYRDLSGLEIRNQTGEVIQKVGGPSGGAPMGAGGTRDHPPPTGLAEGGNPPAVPSPVPAPLQDVALSYFLTAYATTGRFSYMPGFVARNLLSITPGRAGAGDASSPLPDATLALSLAALAQAPGCSYGPVLPLAYRTYNRAVRSVNQALSSPASAVLDSTLLSVLLLGVFETMQSSGSSPPSLTAHIEGSLALLKLRGPDQCRTDVGRDLFLHAADNILTNFALRGYRAPRALQELHAQATERDALGEGGSQYAAITAMTGRMIEFRQDITALGGFTSPLARTQVRTALELDEIAVGMLRALRRRYQEGGGGRGGALAPEVGDGAAAEGTHEVGGIPFHSDVLRYWVTFQAWRLMLTAWSFQCLAASPRCPCSGNEAGADAGAGPHARCLTPEQETVALQVLCTRGYQACREILDHMPYFIEQASQPLLRPAIRYLVFPLALVAITPFGPQGPKSNRVVCLGYLRALARRFGFARAEWAARMVEEANAIEDWVHMLHLS